MAKRSFISPIGFVFFFVFISCHKNHDNNVCVSYTKATVTKIEGLNTGLVNQDINLGVLFYYADGCGQSASIEQSADKDTTTINVIAKYQGCLCTDILLGGKVVFNFRKTQPGTYYLKFWQSDKSYLTDTIIIR